ncbi:hypothetical protein ZIOFF_069679 [Zingiber officinale]|uniref:Pentatricopeptide repeat-containing protein n=1 Tax=Zingiber officinale TaxID=94328 RepID=A0A8J5EQ36_ZINOF|nr:hypothetical protein ZIOFF_069679 [Zingiber officinale]
MENKLKRRGGLVAAPLLPTSPLKPKASKAFKEDLENQDPNQSTPSRLPRQTKTWNTMKEMIKSSAGKKVKEEREELKPKKLPPRLKSMMSARNLFSGKDLLSQISEFYHKLKRMAVGSKTPVGEEVKKEVNNVAESPQQDSKLLIPNKLKIVIEKSTFLKDVRANPPTLQSFPYPRGEREVLQEDSCSFMEEARCIAPRPAIHRRITLPLPIHHLFAEIPHRSLLRPALLHSQLLFPNPSTFQWNTIIQAYSSCHFPRESLNLFRKMHQKSMTPDAYTFQFMFKSCGLVGLTLEGQMVHALSYWWDQGYIKGLRIYLWTDYSSGGVGWLLEQLIASGGVEEW